MPIELPTDIYLLDNISTITVSFDCSGLETKTMNLPASCVQVVNLPATYQLTVISGLSLSAARRAQIEAVRVAAALRGHRACAGSRRPRSVRRGPPRPPRSGR